MLARCRAECEPRLPTGVEGRVVVSLGLNDTTIENGSPRVGAPASVAHLAGVLDEVTGSTPWSAFVVGPPPVGDDQQNHRTADPDDAFAHICARAGVPYVRVLPVLLRSESWMPQVREGDGSPPRRRLRGTHRPHPATLASVAGHPTLTGPRPTVAGRPGAPCGGCFPPGTTPCR